MPSGLNVASTTTRRKMFRVKSTRRNGKRSGSDAATAPVSVPTTTVATPIPATTIAETTAVATTVAKPGNNINTSSSNTVEFFAAERAATALTKPWLRLERGLRLQRFRAYAEAYPGLSASEKTRLYDVLVASNDKKLLNTKQQVTYENGVIQSIRGLKVIRTGDAAEPAVIKIEPPQVTKRNTKDV